MKSHKNGRANRLEAVRSRDKCAHFNSKAGCCTQANKSRGRMYKVCNPHICLGYKERL